METTLPKLATVEELESELGSLTRFRLYELCRLGLIPHLRVGRSIRFDRQAISQWIAEGGTREDGPDQ